MSDIRVRAIHRGYFGGLIRERGDEFVAPSDMASAWWEPVDPVAALVDPAPVDPVPEQTKAKPGPKPKAKAETVAAPAAEPFIEPPQPVRVENEINAATGGTQPDWVAPVSGDI